MLMREKGAVAPVVYDLPADPDEVCAADALSRTKSALSLLCVRIAVSAHASAFMPWAVVQTPYAALPHAQDIKSLGQERAPELPEDGASVNFCDLRCQCSAPTVVMLAAQEVRSLGEGRRLEVPEDGASVNLGDLGPFASNVTRIQYSSLVTPPSTFDFDLLTGSCSVLQCAVYRSSRHSTWHSSVFLLCDLQVDRSERMHRQRCTLFPHQLCRHARIMS